MNDLKKTFLAGFFVLAILLLTPYYLQLIGYQDSVSENIIKSDVGAEPPSSLVEDVETVLKPNMVVSMEPMILIPEGKAGAGGYREHDILVIKENGAEDITKFPFGPEHNVIK